MLRSFGSSSSVGAWAACAALLILGERSCAAVRTGRSSVSTSKETFIVSVSRRTGRTVALRTACSVSGGSSVSRSTCRTVALDAARSVSGGSSVSGPTCRTVALGTARSVSGRTALGGLSAHCRTVCASLLLGTVLCLLTSCRTVCTALRLGGSCRTVCTRTALGGRCPCRTLPAALSRLRAGCRTVCPRRTVTLWTGRTAALGFLALVLREISSFLAGRVLRAHHGNDIFLFRTVRFRFFSCPLLYFSGFCLFFLHWLSLLF